MESTVPLDAHGNPITDDDEIFAPIDSEEYGAQLEETIGLTTTRDGVDEVCGLTIPGFQGEVHHSHCWVQENELGIHLKTTDDDGPPPGIRMA